jgi:hypothetical protein
MRHQLPFDDTRAGARLAALVVLVALLAVIGSIRYRGPAQALRSLSPASGVARGAPGLFLLGESTHQ